MVKNCTQSAHKMTALGGLKMAKVGSAELIKLLKVTTFWDVFSGLKSVKDLGFWVKKSVKKWYI